MPARPCPLLPSGQAERRDPTLTLSFTVLHLAYWVTLWFFRPQASVSCLGAIKRWEKARILAPVADHCFLQRSHFLCPPSHLAPSAALFSITPPSLFVRRQSLQRHLSCAFLVKSWEPHRIPHSVFRPKDTTGASQFLNQSVMHSFAGGLTRLLHTSSWETDHCML